MSRTMVDKNGNKVDVIMELGPSGTGSYPAPKTTCTLVFIYEDGRKVMRTAKPGDKQNMTDDELLALLEKNIEGND